MPWSDYLTYLYVRIYSCNQNHSTKYGQVKRDLTKAIENILLYSIVPRNKVSSIIYTFKHLSSQKTIDRFEEKAQYH